MSHRTIWTALPLVALLALFVWALPGGATEPVKDEWPSDPSKSSLAALAARLKPLHRAPEAPQPGDWRAGPGRDEPGQSYTAWRKSDPVRAKGARRTIYMQVIGKPKTEPARIMTLAAEFLGIYFGLPVKQLDPVAVDDEWPYYARRTDGSVGTDQLLTRYILHHVLKPSLPKDGAVLLGLTDFDLWPGRGWNFVFGQASIHSRVGVWSLARYGDPSKDAAAWRRCLLRTLKVATHETGHMFSIEHCTAYRCNMCGSNHLEETDRHPLALCPECAPKLWEATGVDPRKRYRDLAAFCERHGLTEDARFFRKSLEVVGGGRNRNRDRGHRKLPLTGTLAGMASLPMHERADREEVTTRFFHGTAETYDRVVRWASYGLDARWKQRLMEHVPTDAKRVLDFACGTGIVLEHLHERAPDAALVGVDYTQEYLDLALQRFEGRDLDLTLLNRNAEEVELDGTFDCVVSSYLPKYVNASHLFERFHDHIEPGARVAFHDFGHPHAFTRWVWRAHMGFLKHVGRRLLPAWRECFHDDLEALIRHSRWQDSFEGTFLRFGYTDVRVEVLSFRTAYIVSGRRGTRTIAEAQALVGPDPASGPGGLALT